MENNQQELFPEDLFQAIVNTTRAVKELLNQTNSHSLNHPINIIAKQLAEIKQDLFSLQQEELSGFERSIK